MKHESGLKPGELVINEVRGDYYEGLFVFSIKHSGTWTFTNQRVFFHEMKLIGSGEEAEFYYKDIESVKKCTVGPLLPFGIKVRTKEGKKYTLSLLKRNTYIEMLQNGMSDFQREAVEV